MADTRTPNEKAYDRAYDRRPDVKKKRAQRNKARRMMIREGRVSKGDNLDVDHKQALSNGGATTKGNIRVISRSTNRGWRKGKSGYKV